MGHHMFAVPTDANVLSSARFTGCYKAMLLASSEGYRPAPTCFTRGLPLCSRIVDLVRLVDLFIYLLCKHYRSAC